MIIKGIGLLSPFSDIPDFIQHINLILTQYDINIESINKSETFYSIDYKERKDKNTITNFNIWYFQLYPAGHIWDAQWNMSEGLNQWRNTYKKLQEEGWIFDIVPRVIEKSVYNNNQLPPSVPYMYVFMYRNTKIKNEQKKISFFSKVRNLFNTIKYK